MIRATRSSFSMNSHSSCSLEVPILWAQGFLVSAGPPPAPMILSIDGVWETQLRETKTLGKIFWFGLCDLEVAPEQDVVPCAQEAPVLSGQGR